MGFQSLISIFLVCSISCFSVLAQQPYEGQAFSDCKTSSNSTSVLGYSCNGRHSTCQSFLIFRARSSYNSVTSISDLFSSNASQLAQINSVSDFATFPINKEVIIPVKCSCSGGYYQINSTYLIKHLDTYFLVANNTFQGLTTCQALKSQNGYGAKEIVSGLVIRVPIRCACPTSRQISNGTKYLMTYTVNPGDYVYRVSMSFNVYYQNTLDANALTERNSTLYPFSTLLIPLSTEPSISQTITPPPPPPSNPLPSSERNSKKLIYIGIVVAVIGVILIMSGVLLYSFLQKNKKTDQIRTVDDSEKYEKDYEEDYKPKSALPEDLLVGILDMGHVLKVYKFEELQSATMNFSLTSKIKGSVYQGSMDCHLVAIKMIDGDVSKEINILNRINHFNVIRLLGVCFDQGHYYLVYEFAENGSLSNWIFDQSGSKVLSWTQRVQIALDVANGLHYLHNYTEPACVHRDIKSSNLLLDRDLRAKIANFGSARSTEGEGGEFVLTRHVVGTKGYLAPEYLENGFVSPKLDVYAFGVVILEMITGQEALIKHKGDMFLSQTLQEALLEEDKVEERVGELIDPSLQGNYPLDLALIMAKLIQTCLSQDPVRRPGMEEIVSSLSRIFATSLTWELSGNVSESGI